MTGYSVASPSQGVRVSVPNAIWKPENLPIILTECTAFSKSGL